MASIRDPELCAAYHVRIPIAPRPRPDALQVAAGIGLGERDTRPARSSCELGQVAGLLRFGSVAVDHPARERVAPENPGDAHPASGQLLEDQRERHHVGAHAAVALGNGQAEEPHRLHGVHDLGRVTAPLLPVMRYRNDVIADEVLQHRPEHRLLVAELEIHLRPPSVAARDHLTADACRPASLAPASDRTG